MLVAVGVAAPARKSQDQPGCLDTYSPPQVTLPNVLPFDAQRADASVSPTAGALRELNAGRGSFEARGGGVSRPIFARKSPPIRSASALPATAKPPQLATLRVRVLGYAEDAPKMVPQPGARVDVDRIPVGERAVTADSPPACPPYVEVSAEIPLTLANFAEVTRAPGKSGSGEITLSDDKEVDEHTTLLLVEVVDPIVYLILPSFSVEVHAGQSVRAGGADRAD